MSSFILSVLLTFCLAVSAWAADQSTQFSKLHLHNGYTLSHPNAMAVMQNFSIFPRQSGCDTGLIPCGSGCIEQDNTCCPDGRGGCPPSQYCSQSSSTEYGCCDNGKTCDGPPSSCADSSYKPCGEVCFPESYTCCSLGGACAPGYSCGSNGCEQNTNSDCDQKCSGSCYPSDYVCCSLGGACAPGYHCGPSGCLAAGTCASSEKHCGDECFPTSYTCCSLGGACEPGWHCSSSGCQEDSLSSSSDGIATTSTDGTTTTSTFSAATVASSSAIESFAGTTNAPSATTLTAPASSTSAGNTNKPANSSKFMAQFISVVLVLSTSILQHIL